MKVILHSNRVIVRVVVESDSDYEYHLNRGEGIELPNDTVVSAGQYIELDNTIRDLKQLDLISTHGCKDCMNSLELKYHLSRYAEEFSNSSEEVSSWYNSLSTEVLVNFADDSLPIYTVDFIDYRFIYDVLGVVTFAQVLSQNQHYVQPVVE